MPMLPVSKTVVPAAFAALLAVGALSGAAHAACTAKAGMLGVARTITIDTSGGKTYGGLQYPGEPSLLKDGEVILTFDDGPLRPHTRKVLAALQSHCTKATFFMVGRMAVADPAMVREVAAAGHTIATHTWSHQNLHNRNARRAGGEIELGISAVRAAAEAPITPFFRFPYLADPNVMIAYGKERNLAIFSIDIDSNDYRTQSPEKVFSTIMSQLRARRKGIMLFHDIQKSTAGAIQRILDTMQREGFKVVHIAAKSPVKTLADFDKQAEALHDKKRTVATANAIDGGAYENVARSRHRVEPETKTSAPKVAAVANQPHPVATKNPFDIGPAQQNARDTPKRDWRQSIWGN